MRLILYGMGNIFNRYINYVDWNSVIAIADKKQNQLFWKKKIPVIVPNEIGRFSFDYIVVFSDIYFESIKEELIGKYFVLQGKIISWRAFLKGDYPASNIGGDFYKKFILEHHTYKILDIGMEELSKFFISVKGISERENLRIDGVGDLKTPIYKNLYNNTYVSIRSIFVPYDLLIIQKRFIQQIKIEELLSLNPNYLIIAETYHYLENRKDTWLQESYLGYQKNEFILPDERIYVYEKENRLIDTDCKIYVVTHKEYNIKGDSLYIPLCVGSEYKNSSYLNEKTGENISELNERLNECTALYWIWKNTNSEYVGLNHYRRYFYNTHLKYSANYLSQKKIHYILKEKKYGIILPELKRLPISVLDNISGVVGNELSNKAYETVVMFMKKRQPDYIDSFRTVMHGNLLYPCNMFVTSRSILDLYCQWLFSFIIEAARELDVSLHNKTQKRVIGYFAEAMITCWLMKQDIRIWELPITDVT